jgi:hypothetical protein
MRPMFHGLIADTWKGILVNQRGWPLPAAERMAAFLADNGPIPEWAELTFDAGPGPMQHWTCGHVAPGMCSQCYTELANKAHLLAEELVELKEPHT